MQAINNAPSTEIVRDAARSLSNDAMDDVVAGRQLDRLVDDGADVIDDAAEIATTGSKPALRRPRRSRHEAQQAPGSWHNATYMTQLGLAK
jgi:hypothetical protein